MVATGTGLAPYMSMLRTGITANPSRRFAVLAGARHSWDLGYTAELTTLARVCPNFAYLPVVSRPKDEPTTWGGATGYVQSLWEGGALEKAFGKRPTGVRHPRLPLRQPAHDRGHDQAAHRRRASWCTRRGAPDRSTSRSTGNRGRGGEAVAGPR